VEGARNVASADQAQMEMEKVVLVRDVEVSSLRAEVAELRESLGKSEAVRATQIESLRESRDSADLARSEVRRLSESLSLLAAERTEDKIRAEKAREVADSQQRELMSMLKDRIADIERLSTIHESDISSRMELEKAVESWKARHQTALDMCEALKTESSQRVQILEGKCEKQKRSLAEMRSVLKDLKEAKDELGVKHQEAQAALQLSREAEETLKSTSDKRNAALNDKLALLEREFSSLSLLGGKGASNPQKVIELERKCVDLETNLRVKTTMLDDQNDAMRLLRQRNIELEVQVRETDRDMDALEEDVVGLKKIITDLEMQLDHKSTIEADLRRLVAKLTRDLGSGSIGVNTIKDMLKQSKNDRYSENLGGHGSDDDFEEVDEESEEGQNFGDREEYSDEFDRIAVTES
jgi:chromosome segregation ATPase